MPKPRRKRVRRAVRPEIFRGFTARTQNDATRKHRFFRTFHPFFYTQNEPLARFLHIEGVRFEVSDTACFDYLIRGGVEEAPVPQQEAMPEASPIVMPPARMPNDRPEVIDGS